MKKNQVSHADRFRDAHAFTPTRMAPSPVKFQLLRSVLSVVNEDIRTLG